MVNVDRNMNAPQIEFCAEQIIENQWMYSLEDIQLALDRGCFGIYGELYNRLDPSVIFGWFKQYEVERMRVIMDRRKKEVATNNIYEIFNSPVMSDVLKQVTDKLLIHEEKKVEPEPERKPLSPFEQQVMDEWDNLEYMEGRNYVRHYKSGIYDFTMYRKKRYEELIEEHNKQEQE